VKISVLYVQWRAMAKACQTRYFKWPKEYILSFRLLIAECAGVVPGSQDLIANCYMRHLWHLRHLQPGLLDRRKQARSHATMVPISNTQAWVMKRNQGFIGEVSRKFNCSSPAGEVLPVISLVRRIAVMTNAPWQVAILADHV
jgi:hypothetical protein